MNPLQWMVPNRMSPNRWSVKMFWTSNHCFWVKYSLSIILLSPVTKSHLKYERNMHRPSTVNKRKQTKTVLNKYVGGFWTGYRLFHRRKCYYGLLWCFNQLFSLSLWRHPFTAENQFGEQVWLVTLAHLNANFITKFKFFPPWTIPWKYSYYCCSVNFHGQNPVISIWIFAICYFMQGDKGFPPVVDHSNVQHWPIESYLVWKWLLCKQCLKYHYMTANREWTFLPAHFIQNIANVTRPLH